MLDSRGLILLDPRLREATAANIGLIVDHTYWWPNGESGLYRPFATLSWLFNYTVLGNRDQALGYHAINLLLHAGNVLLVYALAVRLFREQRTAFFTAALWAVHPILTESVTNLAGRSDLLAAAGLLGGLLAYLKCADTEGRQRYVWLAVLAASTAAGVFSKETAVVLPVVLVLYELTFHRDRPWGKAQVSGLAAAVAPVALMLVQRSRVLSGTLPMEIPFTDNPIAWAGFATGRLTALEVITRGLGIILCPVNLSADYSWSQIQLWKGSVADWAMVLAALAIVPLAAVFYRWNRASFFFFCMGLGWLAPASNLVLPIGSILAERFYYLPALGLMACLAPAIFAAAKSRYAPVLLCLAIAVLGIRTWIRNADWKDDLSIAESSVRTSPLSFKTHDLLANVLFTSDPTHSNIQRVIEESEASRAALDSLPDARKPPDPYRFAADCYMYREDYRNAVDMLRTFLSIERIQPVQFDKQAIHPRESDAYLMLSSAYMAMGDSSHASEAISHTDSSVALNPQFYRVQADIAAVQGRIDDAAVALVEGAFITSEKTLRQALIDLYKRATDPASCALTAGPSGPAINPRCAMVHAHVCAASAYVVKTLADLKQTETAQTRKKMFLEQFGCPKEPLDHALP